MRKWWGIWSGHIFLLAAILMALASAYLLWGSVRANNPDGRFVLGMAFILGGVLTFCLGMLAAYHWNTRIQRRGLRQGTIVNGRGSRQMPPGGHD